MVANTTPPPPKKKSDVRGGVVVRKTPEHDTFKQIMSIIESNRNFFVGLGPTDRLQSTLLKKHGRKKYGAMLALQFLCVSS